MLPCGIGGGNQDSNSLKPSLVNCRAYGIMSPNIWMMSKSMALIRVQRSLLYSAEVTGVNICFLGFNLIQIFGQVISLKFLVKNRNLD